MSATPKRQFDLYTERQPEVPHIPIDQPNWFAQPSERKPPRPVGEVRFSWEEARQEIALDYATTALDASYVIGDRPSVVQFILEHRLHGLLRAASEPLDSKFGDRCIKTLSIVCDDEGFETLFCVVAVSGDLQQTRDALTRFDRDWWLFHVPQASGRLNFDFKII